MMSLAVQPRWRGEHRHLVAPARVLDGSAPLARGTQTPSSGATSRLWFSPAGAGNTPELAGRPPAKTVQPRWRGEHYDSEGVGYSTVGSAPLARGTLLSGWPHRPHARFSPAGAGNTQSSSSGSWRTPVQPRWRGEHANDLFKKFHDDGSAPLARGTHRAAACVPSSDRFSPAGAGNTFAVKCLALRYPVQPRWRGEHCHRPGPGGPDLGSAPLARGTPLGHRSQF